MKNNLVGVMYIGSKPEKTDNVANTGAKWVPGQTINFPMDVARKLLVHTNVWELVEVDPNGETHIGGKKSQSNAAEPVPFININEMDVNALAAYARVEFNQSIDPNIDVAAARTLVLGYMTNANIDAEAVRITALKSANHYIGIEVGEDEYQAYLAGDVILKLVPKPAEGAQTGGLSELNTVVVPKGTETLTVKVTGGSGDAPKPTPEDLQEALAELPGEYNESDSDYVLTGMRAHFGELFTPEVQEKVLGLLKPTAAPEGNQDANKENVDPLAGLKADLEKLDKKGLRELCDQYGIKSANVMTVEVLRAKIIAKAEESK